MDRMDWHRRFLHMAGLVASWSKDPSTRVGAVIVRPGSWTVVTTGYNGFPRGVEEMESVDEGLVIATQYNDRWKRPQKYQWVEHAERNAIYQAAREGQAIDGCVLYLNWNPCPCTGCARAIIQAGIVEVVGDDRPFEGKGEQWEADLAIAREMLDEAGVIMTTIERPGQ